MTSILHQLESLQKHTFPRQQRLLQYNDADDDDTWRDGDESVYILFFIVPFFICWNGAIGAHVVHAFGHLLQGKCTSSIMILVCPHWLLGIVVPTLIGYGTGGIPSAALAFATAVLLPYTAIIFLYCRRPHEEREVGGNVAFQQPHQPMSRIDERDDNLLIIKTVLPAGGEQKLSQDEMGRLMFGKNKNKRVNNTYGLTHPKSDIYARSSTTHNSSSMSVQLCAICLEEYQVGESIAWSRNPACHHVFHKKCLLNHLRASSNQDDCPICRNTYHVMTSINLDDGDDGNNNDVETATNPATLPTAPPEEEVAANNLSWLQYALSRQH